MSYDLFCWPRDLKGVTPRQHIFNNLIAVDNFVSKSKPFCSLLWPFCYTAHPTNCFTAYESVFEKEAVNISPFLICLPKWRNWKYRNIFIVSTCRAGEGGRYTGCKSKALRSPSALSKWMLSARMSYFHIWHRITFEKCRHKYESPTPPAPCGHRAFIWLTLSCLI